MCREFLFYLCIIMKRVSIILLAIFLILTGCKKDKTPSLSGTVTIDNNLEGNDKTGYYAYGFSFVLAKKVSTVDNPPPDITIDNDGTPANLVLQANNFKDSFYKAGEFADATAAQQAFKNLTSLPVPQPAYWSEWAYLIKPNQIWIYRSGTEHFSKFRIISTNSEPRVPRDFAECTFEWVYQPDGSLTFP